jgi:hypothetical protein
MTIELNRNGNIISNQRLGELSSLSRGTADVVTLPREDLKLLIKRLSCVESTLQRFFATADKRRSHRCRGGSWCDCVNHFV